MGDVTFAATHPKARKAHECDECGRWIAVGETYRRQGYTYEGVAYTFRCCEQCEAFLRVLLDAGFENDEGGWPRIVDLDGGEVAHVGLSRELQLFRDRWQRNGVLIHYPTSPDSKKGDR